MEEHMKKRVLLFIFVAISLIIIALLFTLFNNHPIESGTSLDYQRNSDKITKEQWINALVEITEYEFFDDNIKSQEYATKDFVAQTSIQATGIIGESEIKFDDALLIKDLNSARMAVQSEILKKEQGNNFNPNRSLTIAESKNALNRIKEIIAIPVINPNHEDKVTFQNGVIDMSYLNNDDFIINKSDETSIVFNKADIPTLKKDDIYIIPATNSFPNGAAFKVSKVEEADDTVTVYNTEANINEVLSSIDIQGIYYPDLNNISTYAGVEDLSASNALYASIGNNFAMGVMHLNNNYTDKATEIEFGIGLSEDSYSISGTVKLTPKMTAVCDIIYDVNLFREDEFKVNELYFMLELESVVSVDFTGEIEKEIPIASFPFPIAPGLSISVDVALVPSLEGGLNISISNSASVGYKYINNALCRLPSNSNNDEIKLDASVSLTLELPFNVGIGFNILNYKLVQGGVTVGMGATVATDLQTACLDANIYNILRLFLKIDLFVFDIEEDFAIYDSDTVNGEKWQWHFEDGGWVPKCTRNGDNSDVVSDSSNEGLTEDNSNNLLWRDIYLNYLPTYKDVFNTFIDLDDNSFSVSFQLIYIDDDDVPELYMATEPLAYGESLSFLCSIASDGSIKEHDFLDDSFDYNERESLISISRWGGGISSTRIYSFQNGELVILHHFEESYDFENDITTFYNNGEEISEEEYFQLTDMSMSGSASYYTGVSMQEIISILENNENNDFKNGG